MPFASMPTSECCCCVCTTHFCVFQSVIGLHTLYLIFQEQTEANSSSEDMDTQMANKGKYYKTHTVKTKVVLDFLFRKVKKIYSVIGTPSLKRSASVRDRLAKYQLAVNRQAVTVPRSVSMFTVWTDIQNLLADGLLKYIKMTYGGARV